MALHNNTLRDLGRLHRVFALASMLLLAATFWAIWDDSYRPWHDVQKKAAQWDRAMNLRPAAPPGRHEAEFQISHSRFQKIRQVVVNDVLTDLSFSSVATTERCVTCHVNADRKEFTGDAVVASLEKQLVGDGEAADAVSQFWQGEAAHAPGGNAAACSCRPPAGDSGAPSCAGIRRSDGALPALPDRSGQHDSPTARRVATRCIPPAAGASSAWALRRTG